jgi:hypothetical protein
MPLLAGSKLLPEEAVGPEIVSMGMRLGELGVKETGEGLPAGPGLVNDEGRYPAYPAPEL